ncbi:flagella assembly protein FlgT [Pseudocolwellia agarivorans]|uniref:flagella assembly protein FlgT n=1 Tax=Pseudocolwellia agarivorans TaxID=1911682 RepID=UPI000986A49A|nr:flagella assembly protein FlgT [Pseudocolwellia agarivorans]
MKKLLILLSFALTSFSAFTQWYETQGQAYIADGNHESARTTAMENALKRALLVAGASVSSVQQVINGVLTQDQISVRASGTVNSFELIEETYKGDLLTVKIRADIFPQEKQCFSADYRKSVLLTRGNILNREQANVGKIYALDTEVIRKLSAKINKEGYYLDSKLAIKSKSGFSRYNESMQYEKIKNLAMSLSDHTDTQFIMFIEFPDLSLTQRTNSELKFWQKDHLDRHFKINLYIYNGSNGELVLDKQYQNTAPWTFDKREKIDVTSNTFWLSEYGNSIDHTLDMMISDIDENMMCQPTRGKIVKVEGDTVLFNLGENQGVKVGDEFSLLHANNFISDSGKNYSGFNVSPYKVKVISTSKESARAVTQDNNLLGNIQINDIAVRY